MVATIAERLGIPFERAEEMAIAAAKAGLVRHLVHTVSLTAKGFNRAATLKPPAPSKPVKKPAGFRQPATRLAAQAKRRARPR